MNGIYLYNKSNKIRSILLIAIDKELFNIKNKNTLLINSLDQWQLIDKFKENNNYTIESIESFKGTLNNEENNKNYIDIKYNNKKNQVYFTTYSLNEGMFFNTSKSYKKTKNTVQYFFLNKTSRRDGNKKCVDIISNSLNKKKLEKKNEENKDSKDNSNEDCKERKPHKILRVKTTKLKNHKKEYKTKFSSSKEIQNINKIKNFASTKNNKIEDKKPNPDKLVPVDFTGYTSSDENNMCNYMSKLINYCFYLKKPIEEVIKGTTCDDTSPIKDTKKRKYHRTKYTKNLWKKKMKKTINKNNNNNNNSSGDDK